MNLKEQDNKERKEWNDLFKKYKTEGLCYKDARESANAEFDWLYAGHDLVERYSNTYINDVISYIKSAYRTIIDSKYDYDNMELYLSHRQYPYTIVKIFNRKEKMMKIYGHDEFNDCMRYIIGLKLQKINNVKNLYYLTTNDPYRGYTVSVELEIYL